jgi:hypothetical protein
MSVWRCACALALAWLTSAPAHAQSAMDAWASFVLAPKVWKGQVVPEPDATPRPSGPELRLDSWRLPLHVHAPTTLPKAQLRAALSALEDAYQALSERGWPLPFPDGGYGGTPGFDLYLQPHAAAPASAQLDAPAPLSDFDAAQTYAVVDAAVSVADLPACVQSAFTQAALRAQDPSEAESWLRASGDFSAWLFDGEPGCQQSMVQAQQTPELGLLNHDPRSAGSGALALALLSERHDGGSGQFVQALWELTRQRSRGMVDHGLLRSSPDLWEVLVQVLKASSHEQWQDALDELAAARFFSGERTRRAAAAYRTLSALPSDAQVPVLGDLAWAQLPAHLLSDEAGLQELGSAYVRVRLPSPGGADGLRIWLRGELGPRWSLLAIRLDQAGQELGRVSAAERRLPQSYLPITLTPDTAQVIVVVSYLAEKTPDADRSLWPAHAFELIVDRGAVQ